MYRSGLRYKTLKISLTYILLGFTAQSIALAAPVSDIEFERAVKMLSDYIKVDTTNPPGNEALGAVFLGKILASHGIPYQIIPCKSADRSAVMARLPGNGKKKACILLSHIDVVPAQKSDWIHDPFAGEIHDGELWGRGALDMKGMAMIQLAAFLSIKESGKHLDRDLIFLATPDEETGGEQGAQILVKEHQALFKDAEYLLNEGFSIEVDEQGKPKYWGVDFAEKNVLWLALSAKGLAGHASMPQANSANNRLVRAIARLLDDPPPQRLLPEVEQYLTTLAKIQNISPDSDAFKKSLSLDPLKSSMMRDTISLTNLKAGYKTNVIPAEAYAELDCRLLPGTDREEFIAGIKKRLADDSIQVKILESETGNQSPADKEDAMFRAITKASALDSPGQPPCPVVPVVVPWSTDSHYFRTLGIKSYGFEPVEVDADHLATMHGKNERIPLQAYRRAIGRMIDILTNL